VDFKRFCGLAASIDSRGFYQFVCVDALYDDTKMKQGRPTANISKLIPLYHEVAHPSKMRRVPIVQFYYETILGLLFIGMSIERILAGAGDKRVDMGNLMVLIVGNMLYEAGQITDIGWSAYIKVSCTVLYSCTTVLY
jgi:hypothetical protein